MYTKQLDNGILNNYAVEPDMYYAASPSLSERYQYAIQGGFATLLIATLFLLSFAAS
jgi:hypothetical protein